MGLWLGPLLFLLTVLLPRPAGLSSEGQSALAVTLWTATWWLTEALPINATALLPFLLFPFTGVMTAPEAAEASMSDSLYLFLGGFFIAAALERWGLHRRLALGTLRIMGTSPRRLIAGVMAIVAFLSLWLTNTATTVMMIPILLAVVDQARRTLGDGPEANRFAAALLLGTALAANIGGMGTPVGTVPNAVMIGQLADRDVSISFLEWMGHALPVVIILVPLAWLILVGWSAKVPKTLRIGNIDAIRKEARDLGPWTPAEKRVGLVFVIAVVLWVTRQDLNIGVTIPGWASALEALGIVPEGKAAGIRDGSVAVLAALLLFLLPSGHQGERLLDWERAARVPWGILILLGGGFVLAAGFTIKGADGDSLGVWLGSYLGNFRELPFLVQLLLVSLLVSMLTEFASNTATCILILPILFAVAAEGGMDVIPFGFAAALAASCSFMMPVATPPNALVFGTGKIPMRLMLRNGIVLNIVGALVIGGMAWLRS